MTDFAYSFYQDDLDDDAPNKARDKLAKIDAQAHFAEAILQELEGSATISLMLEKAKDGYIEAVRAIVEVNPFESEQERARFIRLQHQAKMFRYMVSWLEEQGAIFIRAQDFNRDAQVQRIRGELESDERPTE